MFRIFLLATVTSLCVSGSALAADKILGSWRTDAGETAAITGGGPFAITVKTGKHAGKRIGNMNPAGDGKYAGELTDPANNKTYIGKATLSGNSLKMSGCVLGGLICRTQNWKRQ